MTEPTFAQFETTARAQGFDEVIERQWAPDTWLDTHSHAFDVSARVVDGEFWLTVGDQVRHLQSGDRFELDAGVPHAERYGPQGARYWVARRHRPGAQPG